LIKFEDPDCLAHVYGNAADRPDRKRAYPSDMTDAEWAAVRDQLPLMSSLSLAFDLGKIVSW
jgi:hypothetical protein